MYHQDWLMRQIEAITTMLGYILFGKSLAAPLAQAQQATASGENELYLQLHLLVMQKDICQAENLLYEALEDPGHQVLDAARRFYEEINQLSDAQLVECNFSREEIMSGLQHVCEIFGIPL